MDSIRDAYRKKMEAQIDEWSAKIDVLKARLGQKKADAQIELHRSVEELEQLRASARIQLDAFTAAWQKLTGAFDAVAQRVA